MSDRNQEGQEDGTVPSSYASSSSSSTAPPSYASMLKFSKAINIVSSVLLTICIIPLIFIYFVIEFCILIVLKPLIFVYNKTSNVARSSLISNFDGTKFSRIINPETTARLFIEDFNNDVIRLIGDDGESSVGITKPNFFQGGYTEALQLVKDKGKWLIIYLQDDDHEDCGKFILKIILTNEFNNILNNDDIIIWGGNVKKSEAYQVSNTLSATRFPFMALLCLTFDDDTLNNNYEPTTIPLLSVVARIQGYHPVKKICALFKQRISKYEPKLKAFRLQVQKVQKSKLLKKQQDLELEGTLFADQIKKQRRLQMRMDQMNLARFTVRTLQKLILFDNTEVVTRIPSNTPDKKVYRRISITVPNSGERILRFYHENCLTDDIYNVAYFVSNGFIIGTTVQEINFKRLKEYLSRLKVDNSQENLEFQKLKGIHNLRTLESYLSEFAASINSSFSSANASSSNTIRRDSNFQMNYEFVLYNAYPKIELELKKQIKDLDFIQSTSSLFLEKDQQQEESSC